MSRLESFLQGCIESDNFYLCVCLKDENERKAAIDHLVATVKSWLEDKTSEDYSRLLRIYVPGLVRMAQQSPLADVRIPLLELIEELKSHSILIHEVYDSASEQPSDLAPSGFIPPRKLPAFDKSEDTRQFLEEVYFSRGRVSHVTRLVSYYPVYGTKFDRVLETIMNGGGPLPQHWRHYVAIMAASRHHSRYLVVNQQVEFFQSGGDVQWLEGLEHAPAKLQKLAQINAILAHQPWLIKQSHIQNLITGDDSWSIPELVQAVAILSSFHCLAAFAWGAGITMEIDRRGDMGTSITPTLLSPEEGEVTDGDVSLHNTTELVSRLKQFTDKSDTDSISSSSSNSEIAQKFFEESEIGWMPKAKKGTEKRKNVNDFSHYHGGVELAHEDFNVKSADYKVFRLQEFSWEEHGYSLMNRYYPGAGDLLDDLFNETFNLTDYFLFDSTNVDTTPFRQAVWYYVLRLKGMCHDDYEYSQVNVCLNLTIKKYIKKVACYPELVTKIEYANLGIELLDAEKAHINYLIMESRRQSELLYALNVLMRMK